MSVTRVQLVGNVSTGASFAGIVTATSFSGSGANLTGIAATDNVRTNSLVVSGVSTLGTVVVGGATTQLIVTGDARVTGILTVGSASITLDGTNNRINVGTGLTLSSSGIVAGVITATSFVGSGANLTGIANTANIRSDTITVGVLTATTLNVPPVPITFSPGIGVTNISVSSKDGLFLQDHNSRTQDTAVGPSGVHHLVTPPLATGVVQSTMLVTLPS